MVSLLAKRVLSTSLSSLHHHHQNLAFLTPLRHPFSTQPLKQKGNNLVAKYLISSLGLQSDRALKVSTNKRVSSIESEDQLDSVIKFLKDTGFSDAQISSVISCMPAILARNVEKTLKPRMLALMDAGISRELLLPLILYNPQVLELKDCLPRLLFWREFSGNDNQTLLKIIQRNSRLITFGIDNKIVPTFNLLKEYGLSNSNIMTLIQCGFRRLGQNLDSLRETLELTEELGIPRESKMFVYGIRAVASCGKDNVKMKADFFKGRYGWSHEELCFAFSRCPSVLEMSEEKVKSNMNFLIRKAGFEPRRIALHARLITCSVERVLLPRHTVLTALQAKTLKMKTKKMGRLETTCQLSERSFYEKYVVPFEEHVPGLSEAYFAAYGAKKMD